MPASPGRSDRAPTRALARGLEILLTFADEGRPLTLSELSVQLDMSSATAYRLLSTLEQYGFVHRNEDTKQFTPGLAIMTLVPMMLDSFAISDSTRRLVQQLAEETNESANLATLEGASVLYLHSFSRPSMLTVNNPAGLRIHAHCSALGKMLLAAMDDESARMLLGEEPYEARTASTLTRWSDLSADLELARDQGYSLSVEEYESGLCSVAVPVHLPLPNPIALNVSCPSSRWSQDRVADEFVPLLQSAATAIADAHRVRPAAAG